MPSWTDNLQQDHRWTGRQLIDNDEETDDEVVSSNARPEMVERSMGNSARRILLEDDASSDDTDDQDDPAADITASSQISLGSQWETLPSQTRVGKRTLLTAEEMEDSEDEFDEQEEEDDIEHEYSEPTNPFQHLAISAADNEEESVMEDISVHITMPTRDLGYERGSDAIMPGAESDSRDPSKREADHDMDSGTAQDLLDDDILALATTTVLGSQHRAEDSGRVQESQEQEDEPSSSQVIALKRKKKAIKYLERVVLDLLQQLSACVKLELNKVRRDAGADDSGSEEEDDCTAGDDQRAGDVTAEKGTTEEGKTGELSVPLLNRATGEAKYLKYPRKASQTDGSTSLALARFLRVCTLMHEALMSDTTVTKRDIYYKVVPLFGKQSVVDALIDDIVASVGLKRADFNVAASPKGLMAASGLNFWMNGASERLGSTPTFIPHDGKITGFNVAHAPRWILVIEKEATFTTLCASGILADPELGDGILVTGKGYPDFATLHFLRLVGDSFPSCPIAILVDADAHGLDILSIYQYGSKGMRFTAEAEGLALGVRATWMGVKATEWSALNLDMDKLIPITEKDQRFAQSMLLEEDLPAEWKRQLNHMLHLRRKAEIQNLGNIDSAARTHGMDLGLDFVTNATSSLSAHDAPGDAAVLAALAPCADDPVAAQIAITKDTEGNDMQLEARPQLSGVHAYVKTKLKELMSRPTP